VEHSTICIAMHNCFIPLLRPTHKTHLERGAHSSQYGWSYLIMAAPNMVASLSKILSYAGLTISRQNKKSRGWVVSNCDASVFPMYHNVGSICKNALNTLLCRCNCTFNILVFQVLIEKIECYLLHTTHFDAFISFWFKF